MAGGETLHPGASSAEEVLASLLEAEGRCYISESGLITGIDDLTGRIWQAKAYLESGNGTEELREAVERAEKRDFPRL